MTPIYRVQRWWRARQFRRMSPYMGQQLDAYPPFVLTHVLKGQQAALRERYAK